MIELGCCAFNFGWLDLGSALRLVSQLGFRYVDIGANSPNQEAAAADPGRMGAEIREAARRHGLEPVELFVLTIHVDGQPVDVNHPDGALRRKLLQRFRGLCQCAAAAVVAPGLHLAHLRAGGAGSLGRMCWVFPANCSRAGRRSNPGRWRPRC